MQPFKHYLTLLLFLFLAIFNFNCAKDVDIYEELSRYEEPETEETVPSEDATDTESEDESSETPTEELDNRHPIAGAFYVTPNGQSSNDGSSESSAWNLSHAVANAQAGDIVYIKAGLYENGLFTFNNSGTQDEPIIFMGYRDVPGDIDANNQNLLDFETRGRRGTTVLAGGVELDYKNEPSSAEMPLLRKSYVRDEIALRIEASHIQLYNLAVSGYSTGVFISDKSSESKVWNCVFHEQGNMNIGYRDTSHPDRYKGTGLFNRGGTNVDVQFCSFLNPEQNGLLFEGANNGTVQNNIVYSYNPGNGTDYFFLITKKDNTPSENLVFDYNKCERVPGTAHGGHGFIVKNGGMNNTFRHWEVIHTNIEVNFTNANNNLFEKGVIRGGLYDFGDDLAYILVTNGAHDNTFRDIVVDGAWGAIVMHAYRDGASPDPAIDSDDSGYQNKFVNIIGKNCRYGVIFSEYGVNSPNGAVDNMFINCTFYDVEYGIRSYMRNSGNAFYNTTFNTTRGFITNHTHALGGNTHFENCHFGGVANLNNIKDYSGLNNIEGDPQFRDANSIVDFSFDISGLELSSSSPLLGAGKDVNSITDKAEKDFNGKTRTVFNIGAF